MTFTERERSGETQEVPDVERGGAREGRDTVTWLQLCGTDTLHALPRLRQGVRHYTLGSASDQDVVIPSPYVSAQHCRLVRTPLGLRVVDRGSRNGTYFEGRRKRSFYLDPGQAFTVGACAHRVLALDDDMRVHYPETAVASAPAEPADPLGAMLGRYQLERELGAGAMGVVHAAFDPDLQRQIALKVLRGANVTPRARERLLREARAMARLTHPNVVTVYEVGTANGRDFVAMELISGETLADWLRATRRPLAAILDAFVAAGRGLAAAHAAGIVHRDFKPHNVLRSHEGRIVVTDFGLAREVEGQLPLDVALPVGADLVEPTPLVGITVTGSLLGTPPYMAPEQWRGGAVTPATDQFAFCVALWEALAGERPYCGPTLGELRR